MTLTQRASQQASKVNGPLLDPAECLYIYGQPLPAPQGHFGYWADQRVLDRINDLAISLGGKPAAPWTRRLTGT